MNAPLQVKESSNQEPKKPSHHIVEGWQKPLAHLENQVSFS